MRATRHLEAEGPKAEDHTMCIYFILYDIHFKKCEFWFEIWFWPSLFTTKENVSNIVKESHEILFLLNDVIQLFQSKKRKWNNSNNRHVNFQFWDPILNLKNGKTYIFTSFFKTIKFCTLWYIIQLVDMVDHSVDQINVGLHSFKHPNIKMYLHV